MLCEWYIFLCGSHNSETTKQQKDLVKSKGKLIRVQLADRWLKVLALGMECMYIYDLDYSSSLVGRPNLLLVQLFITVVGLAKKITAAQ